MQLVKKKTLLILMLLGMALSAPTISAQVLTPSLDPTEPAILPAATGWREMKTVGLGYGEGSGNRVLDEEQIYEFEKAGATLTAAFQISNFFVEAQSSSITNKTKLEQYYDGEFNNKKAKSQLNLAIIGNEFVSIGMGGAALESDDFISAAYPEVKTKETSTIGSISISLKEVLFFGGGVERIKQTSDYAVPNNWSNTVLGLGLRVGTPGSFRFRLEMSSASSPEAISEAKGTLAEANHPKTTINRSSAEIMFSGLLFSGNLEETKLNSKAIDPQSKEEIGDIARSKSRAGVLWVPEEGLLLGFYFINETLEREFKDTKDEFSFKLGYIF